MQPKKKPNIYIQFLCGGEVTMYFNKTYNIITFL